MKLYRKLVNILIISLFSIPFLNAQLLLAYPGERTEGSLLPTMQNGKWGFINSDGKVVISHEYDAVSDFCKYGYATFQKKLKLGLINTKGQQILPAEYDEIKVIDAVFISVMKGNKWSVVNLNASEKGKTLSYDKIIPLNKRIIAVEADDRFGIVDMLGHELINPIYDTIYEFKIDDDDIPQYFISISGYKKGLINEYGKEITKPIYDFISLNYNLFMCWEGSTFACYSLDGVEILPKINTDFSYINDDYLAFRQEGKTGLFSRKKMAMITKTEYNSFKMMNENLILVSKDGFYGVINKNGKPVLNPEFNDIYLSGPLFVLEKDGYMGLSRLNGRILFKPAYEDILKINNILYKIKKDSLWGLANSSGDILYPPKAIRISIHENTAKAYDKHTLTLINYDAKGKLVDKTELTNVASIKLYKRETEENLNYSSFRRSLGGFSSSFTFRNYGWFKSGGLWGLADSKGEVKIKPSFLYKKDVPGFDLTLVTAETNLDAEFNKKKYTIHRLYGLVNDRSCKYHLGVYLVKTNFFNYTDSLGWFSTRNLKFGCLTRDLRYFPNYSFIGQYSDGLIRFNRDGEVKVINSYAEDVLMSVADYTEYIGLGGYSSLTNQYVRLDGKWGYWDGNANVIIQPMYNFADDFKHGTAIVKGKKGFGVINKHNDTIINLSHSHITRLENSNDSLFVLTKFIKKYGLLNSKGEVITQCIFDDIFPFSKGIACARKGKKYGYIDRNGNTITDFIYDDAKTFSEDLAAVKVGRLWGFIDNKGHTVIEPTYRSVGDFHEGMAKFMDNKGKTGFLNTKGEVAVESQYRTDNDFYKSIVIIRHKGKYGALDKNGNWAIKPKYISFGNFSEEGLAIVKKKYYGIINNEGDLLVPCKYKRIYEYNDDCAIIVKDRLHGYVDKYGEIFIEPQYTSARNFNEGLAAVQIDRKWGYMNKKGEVIIEPKYSSAEDFSGGRALVKYGRDQLLINSEGKELARFDYYDDISAFSKDSIAIIKNSKEQYYIDNNGERLFYKVFDEASQFNNGLACTKLEDNWGIIDLQGNNVTQFKFAKLENLDEGLYKYNISKLFGIGTLDGRIPLNTEYEKVEYFNDNIVRVYVDENMGYVTLDGEWIVKP